MLAELLLGCLSDRKTIVLQVLDPLLDLLFGRFLRPRFRSCESLAIGRYGHHQPQNGTDQSDSTSNPSSSHDDSQKDGDRFWIGKFSAIDIAEGSEAT